MLARSLAFLTLAAFLCSLSFATTFVETPFPDLVKETPTVVHGIIGASSTDWVMGEDSSKRIYTFYQLQLTETFKGAASGSTITIREMGGEKDGIGMQVAGAAQFTRGEDVVLLLSDQNKDGSYEIRGLSSGKFAVRRQEDGRECLSGMGIDSYSGDGIVHGEEGHPDTPSNCPWTLDSLRKLVKEQGGAPSTSVKTTPSAVSSPSAVATVSQGKSEASPAPQLQPSTLQERGSSTGRIWIIVFIFGLIGLVAVLRIKPKR